MNGPSGGHWLDAIGTRAKQRGSQVVASNLPSRLPLHILLGLPAPVEGSSSPIREVYDSAGHWRPPHEDRVP